MSETVDNLSLRIRLLDAHLAQEEARKTDKAIRGIGGSAKKAGKESKEGGKGIGVFGAGLNGLKWTAGVAGLGGLAFGVKDVVKSGEQWQAQQAQLRQSVLSTHRAVTPSMRLLNDAIERSSTHGGFDPQEEAQGLAQFTRLTGSASTALYYQGRALDLARGAHLSYGTAVKMESQIFTGNTGRLQKYLGIIQPVKSLVEGMTAAEKRSNPQLLKKNEELDKHATATLANEMVLKKYGGATKEYGKTTEGALSNAEHGWDLISENLGKVFLPIVSEAANELASVAFEIEKGHGIWKTLGNDAKGVGKDLEGVWGAGKDVVGFLDKMGKAFNIPVEAGGLGAALAAFAGIHGLRHPYKDTKKGAKAAVTTGKFLLAHPELAPVGLPVLAASAYGYDVYHNRGLLAAHAKGALNMFGGGPSSLRQIEESFLGGQVTRGFAHTTAGGKAAPGALSAPEAVVVSKYLEHPRSESGLTPKEVALIEKAFERAHMAPTNIYLDGKQIASVVAGHANHPSVSRGLAEGVAQYSKKMAARK